MCTCFLFKSKHAHVQTHTTVFTSLFPIRSMLMYTHTHHINKTTLSQTLKHRVFPNNKHKRNIKLYIKLTTSTCLVALIEDIQTPGSMFCCLMYFKDNFIKVEILRSLNVQGEVASKSGKVICRAYKLKRCAFHPPLPLFSIL